MNIKKKIAEKICRTRKNNTIKRLWYETVTGFKDTVFESENKLSYIIDKNKKTVRVVPFDKHIKRSVSICGNGKRKILDIKPKCIEDLFKEYSSYKVTIFEDEIFIQGYDENQENLMKNSKKLIDFKAKKASLKQQVLRISQKQLSDCLLKVSGGLDGQLNFFDMNYTYSTDGFDEETISSSAFQKVLKNDKPIINKAIKFLSLFSGIGSPEMALRNIGIDYDLVGFSEIDKYAIKSYCAIHDVDPSDNLGDISKINFKNLVKKTKGMLDLIFHGSPCTDFSVSGHKEGGDEGSGTRSSLMWHTVEAIKSLKPKFVIWENVKGVLMKDHIHNFNKYLDKLKCLGYNSYHKLINAYDFGVAQDRDRIFVVSIREDVDDGFEFPKGYDYKVNLKDIIEDDVDERFYTKKILNPRKTKKYIQYDNSGKGHNSQQNRLYPIDGPICTLPNRNSGDKSQILLSEDPLIGRRLTPLEAWKAMGFSKEDFDKAYSSGQTMGSLYGQAGNSIVPQILEEIFKILFRKHLKVVPLR